MHNSIGGVCVTRIQRTKVITPDYIELLSIDTRSYISKFQFGFSVGAGFEYKLNYKRSVFIEFRYNKQLSNSSTYSFNSTQLELLTGLNI
jgi:opacity protein-like surface antigen